MASNLGVRKMESSTLINIGSFRGVLCVNILYSSRLGIDAMCFNSSETCNEVVGLIDAGGRLRK